MNNICLNALKINKYFLTYLAPTVAAYKGVKESLAETRQYEMHLP